MTKKNEGVILTIHWNSKSVLYTRTRWFFESAITTWPLSSQHKPDGRLNSWISPSPSWPRTNFTYNFKEIRTQSAGDYNFRFSIEFSTEFEINVTNKNGNNASTNKSLNHFIQIANDYHTHHSQIAVHFHDAMIFKVRN